MGDWHDWAGIIAGIVSLVAYVPLVILVLRRRVRPNRASWLIWMAVSILTAFSYYASGARSTVWVVIGYAIGNPIIAILALIYCGEGGWSRLDRWCLVIAGLSGLVWWWFKTPVIAFIMNLLIVRIASLPTIRKAYLKPDSENKFVWLLWFIGCIFNLLALKDWRFIVWIYPVLGFISIGITTILLFLPRKVLAGGLS